MKKISIIILCLISNIAFLNAQVTNSKLASGSWKKFAVDTAGVFKIDKNVLEKIGISTSGLDPRTIKIIGNAGGMLPEANNAFRYKNLPENAIYIKGEEDGVFNDDDYILFYSKGVNTWSVNTKTNKVEHKKNIYSNKTYYFISAGGSVGKRIKPQVKNTNAATLQINTFNDYVFYEQDKTNFLAVGQDWLGESFDVQNSQDFSLKFPNGVANSMLKIKTKAVASSTKSSSMKVTYNSQNLYTLFFQLVSNNAHTRANEVEKTKEVAYTSENISINLTYNNNGNPAAQAYLDYIEISGLKQLKADNFQFGFRSFEAANATGTAQYNISNASNIFQVWDVTNPVNASFVVNQSTGSDFSFKATAGELREYRVLTPNDFLTPLTVQNSSVKNQNLHGLKDINYLIITNESLLNEAQRLAKYHQENSNLTVQTILIDEIFNEFASGSRDIVGIRDFIKHIYDNNSSPAKKLQYVCFFGEASYDFKNRINDNINIVPAYQAKKSYNLATSYVTDDFYGYLEDNEGKMPLQTGGGGTAQNLDVITGRIPVGNLTQAKNVVDKILRYYNASSFGDWHNTITMVADDIDQEADLTLQSGLDIIAEEISAKKPFFNLNKIYADAYKQQNSSGGESYPEAKTAISNAIDRGTLVFDYFGHGGEEGLADERLLDKQQIRAFNNKNTLPLFVTVTCDFSRFDNPARTTAGELVFWHDKGGAASMITTAREIYISTGQSFNKRLMSFLLQYKNEDNTIAEALLQAKNGFNSYQKLFVFYFGDPAMKLAIPKPNVRITKMNGVAITQSIDTLKALSKVSFEGEVTNKNNQILTNFNGTVSTTIFDKPITKQTLNNDGFMVGGVPVINSFLSQESKLFKGKASVTNGKFKFDFVVPKDIKVAYGKGKVSFYADNQSLEKGGANFDIVVGGINPNAPEDTKGPELQAFMNDISFIDGANTNSSPSLLVQLSDENGINTSITSVDHDIVAVIDGDELNPIVLNDYYETELDDYTKGKVVYQLRDLSVGPHTIKIKAWDTHNNSSETTLNFVVVSDSGLTLNNVLNYPNPFVNYTEFWFSHNKPNEPLEVQVQIFTVSGKLVKTINQNITTTGNLSRSINWNGLDDFGNKLAKGVYVYKLTVNSTENNLTAKKYEKLVVL